jgi:5-methyltetrahydrofolate--homocysteine methyltransferase
MSGYEDLSAAVFEGSQDKVIALVQQLLEEGESAQNILNEGLLTGMGKLGVMFKNNEVFVPEVLVAARALNAGTAALKEKFVEEGVKPIGKVVIATVAGDLHDIGKNLVKLMMEGSGFEVIDLGVDVSDENIVSAVEEHKPDILALSALLTTTMNHQGTVIQALEEAGIRDSVKIIVGGAPITEDFSVRIGADLFALDAAGAADVSKAAVSRI